MERVKCLLLCLTVSEASWDVKPVAFRPRLRAEETGLDERSERKGTDEISTFPAPPV